MILGHTIMKIHQVDIKQIIFVLKVVILLSLLTCLKARRLTYVKYWKEKTTGSRILAI